MKKLALILTFVFGVAMIAPAFAIDPAKKEVKKECTMTCAKDGKPCCAAAASKDGKVTCTKAAAAAKTPAKTTNK